MPCVGGCEDLQALDAVVGLQIGALGEDLRRDP
jgi:hypothetical protein